MNIIRMQSLGVFRQIILCLVWRVVNDTGKLDFTDIPISPMILRVICRFGVYVVTLRTWYAGPLRP